MKSELPPIEMQALINALDDGGPQAVGIFISIMTEDNQGVTFTWVHPDAVATGPDAPFVAIMKAVKYGLDRELLAVENNTNTDNAGGQQN